MAEEQVTLDSQNLFLVIILVIIVVTMAGGLLAYICLQLLPDIDTSKLKPKLLLKSQQKRPASPSAVVLPSKIVVTRPASDVGSLASDVGSQTDVRDYCDPSPPPKQVQQVQSASQTSPEEVKPPRRKLPRQRVIYSCEPSPSTSPTQRVFIWSRNNSYDLPEPDKDPESGSDRSRKSTRGTHKKRGNSPLGVYNHFAARRNSAPMNVHMKPARSVFF